ncbi:hypothetical protein AB4Y40_29085 [Paraburkholderia sp. EG287B]|uniref:hypothetical protein n=1 Tax=unclassified Paraburkholderia TaxID=2615204 RepID=UPI0034D37BB7
MNVTKVEADEARSVYSPGFIEGVADWNRDADEDGTAGALLGEAGEMRDADAPLSCTTVAGGSGAAHL